MRLTRALILIPLLAASMQADATPARSSDGPSLTTLLWQVGRCVVARKHDQVRAFLLTDAPSGTVDRRRVPSDRTCLDVFDGDAQVTFTADTYRGALANALVQHDFAAKPAINVSESRAKVDAASAQVPHSAKAPSDLRHRWEAENARLGACTVRADPEAARLWILTAPDSSEDVQQAKALAPAFKACAKAASIVRSDFDREVMRGPVALGYLRFAQ